MPKIVVVDDSPAIRMQVRQALEAAGHEVVEATDGNDGLQKIVALKTPSLVISDFNMPGMDGITMITKVNEALGKGSFPIIMLTTETSENLRQRGREAGMIAWINKPFNQALFLTAISKILARKAA